MGYGLNLPLQACAAEISNKRLLMDMVNDRADALMYTYNWVHDECLFRRLTNTSAKATMFYPYHVCTADGIPITHYDTETAAIAEAERRAKVNPGTSYYVTKAISKSVTQSPVTTTRL